MVAEVPSTVRIGTRRSTLALRQTEIVADLLRASWSGITIEVQTITTDGDRLSSMPLTEIGATGVFTSSLENALEEGQVDLAVHSMKDLPIALKVGLIVGAVPMRANPADSLVTRHNCTLMALPINAKIGTSSSRRAAQLRHIRADFQPIEIRGNIDTRLAKAFAPDGPYDAIVLAHAGLERIQRLNDIREILPLSVMPPAPGQGALGIQCRDEAVWRRLLHPINHPNSENAVLAERAFLAGLGGGCSLPIAAYANMRDQQLNLNGYITSPDGLKQVKVEKTYLIHELKDVVEAGNDLAQLAKEQGAEDLLE